MAACPGLAAVVMHPTFVPVTDVAPGAVCAGLAEWPHGPVTTVYLLPFSRWIYLCAACATRERLRVGGLIDDPTVASWWWDAPLTTPTTRGR